MAKCRARPSDRALPGAFPCRSRPHVAYRGACATVYPARDLSTAESSATVHACRAVSGASRAAGKSTRNAAEKIERFRRPIRRASCPEALRGVVYRRARSPHLMSRAPSPISPRRESRRDPRPKLSATGADRIRRESRLPHAVASVATREVSCGRVGEQLSCPESVTIRIKFAFMPNPMRRKSLAADPDTPLPPIRRRNSKAATPTSPIKACRGQDRDPRGNPRRAPLRLAPPGTPSPESGLSPLARGAVREAPYRSIRQLSARYSC